jgi:3-methyl-2-oxobutanoate hydroxymethyltransferase
VVEHERRKLTAREIVARKGGRKLAMLSAYDSPMALLAERAGMDIILVGDSLGLTVLGYDSTVPVTVNDIVHHCRAVVRGAPHTHVVADLPFLSYHLSDAQALENAGRLLQRGGADSVKLEGGNPHLVARVRAMVAAGIPVMGHLGLTLQSVGVQGTSTQGADVASARRILAEAEAIAAAGAYAIVIEAVPAELAGLITARIGIPTIGIGAGPHCDGQVALVTDLLGIESKLALRFSKRFARLGPEIERAFAAYIAETESGAFPGPELTIPLDPEVLRALNEG